MGLVVSDCSTLIHLAAISRLGLLKEFYERLTVPPTENRLGQAIAPRRLLDRGKVV